MTAASGPVRTFDRVVRTVCSPNCLGTCGVNAFVKDERIVKLEPASFPDPGFERICLRGIAMATQRLHHPDRLTHPMIRTGARGGGGWRRVSWDEAYDYLAQKMLRVAQEHGWRANAWLKGSGNYGYRASTAMKRLANDLGGTCYSFAALTGDFAGMAGFQAILGTFGSANDISEVGGARYVLSAGRNVADTAHSEMHFLFDAMENGTKFVMVDPRFSRSAAKAHEWLSPRPGTDVALVLGMIHVVVTSGLMKDDYMLAHTNAPFLINTETKRIIRERDVFPGGGDCALVWDEAAGGVVAASGAGAPALRGRYNLAAHDGRALAACTAFEASWESWRDFTPEVAETICEVPAAQIRHTAMEYATTDPAWIWFGLGPQRYHHGHMVARAWVTLATLCGNMGKPYAGVNMYDAPNLALAMTPHRAWLEPEGRSGPVLPGTRLVETIADAAPYPVKSLWVGGYGFATQGPMFKRFLQEALPKLELYAVSEQVMTPAAEYADIVLPCVSYYEDDWDFVGGGENWYVQLRRRVVPPVGESRNDFDICKGFAERINGGAAWRLDPETNCRDMLATHPDRRIAAVDWEVLRRDGVARVEVERPYTPYRDMKFNTPSGRIEIYQEQFADIGEEILLFREQFEGQRSEKAKKYPLVMISYKHVHSTHSQHLILPLILEQLPEPRLEISFADAAARSIADGDMVEVFNDRGGFEVKATVTNTVRGGFVAIPQGWWQRYFKAGHPGDLGHIPRNEAQERFAETNLPNWDVLCEVRRKVAA